MIKTVLIKHVEVFGSVLNDASSQNRKAVTVSGLDMARQQMLTAIIKFNKAFFPQ